MSTFSGPEPIAADELEAFAGVISQAFGTPPDPAELQIDRDVVELDRTLACRDRQPDGTERIVGTAAVLSFTLSVPGAELPAAGVTAVAVLPTHRRRGVLSALMRRQLADVAARSEPLAVLWASEPGIYRRYGYGAAAAGLSLTVPRPTAAAITPARTGDLVLRPAAEVQAELAGVYRRVQPQRPGHYRREEIGWRLRLFDPPTRRDGATELQAVLHVDGTGQADGYALYRTKGRFGDTTPDGDVTVTEMLAACPAGYAALWEYLLGLDLMARIRVSVPPDDPVLHLLVDPYAAAPRWSDNLWVRLVDLPAALAGRRYAAAVDVTLEVTDALLRDNAGRWHLQAEAGAPASCRRTDAQPHLTLDTQALATAYLGGPALAALAASGQVAVHDPAALRTASAAFGWERQPYCPQIF